MSTRNVEIEYLRALSIVLVLISHIVLLSPAIYGAIVPLFRHFSFGVGVDLFFCISGFVVASSVVASMDSDRNSFARTSKAFWVRRCFRLLPAAWCWALYNGACSLWFNTSGAFHTPGQNAGSILSIMTLTANISNIYGHLMPNMQYWSLALEEQFYLLFPFFIFLTRRTSTRVAILILAIILQFPLSRNPFGSIEEKYYFSLRTDGFCWGILLYFLSRSQVYQQFAEILKRGRGLTTVLTAGLVFLLVYVPANLGGSTYTVGLLSINCAALVLAASFGSGFTIPSRRPIRSLLYLGERSYSIYLAHIPAIFTTQELLHQLMQRGTLTVESSIVLPIVIFLILLSLFAEVSFRVIETPLRKRGVIISHRMLGPTQPTTELQTCNKPS